MTDTSRGAHQISVGKGTPFTPRTTPLCRSLVWSAWNEYLLPETFTDFDEEVLAMRHGVMLEDKSPLDRYFFSGPDAMSYLNRLVVRDLSRMEINQCYYTPFVDERGKLIIEGIVFRVEENKYCFTSSQMDKWFAEHAPGFDVEIENATDDYGILHVQGPRAHDVVTSATGHDWKELHFSRGTVAQLAGADVRMWRTGFSGEKGYEFWIPAEAALDCWDALMEAGEPFGLINCGHNAQDVGRIEAGMLIPVLDYTRAGPDIFRQDVDPLGVQSVSFEATPAEVGLGYLVNLDKEDFIGKQALVEEKANGGPRRRHVGLRLDWSDLVDLQKKAGLPPEISHRVNRFPLHPIRYEGREVGIASSIAWGPTVGEFIGLGRLDKELAVSGTRLAVDWTVKDQSGAVGATVVDLPFVELKRKK